ncbi:NodT family efflux transporter outer membrane factor (OMF) lipoprotein [Variovorax sp. TBS-050B]|uniref:TolC family protein n=1 Tax=Variovorax sp. TBS-050B TaxID=2940551 RepID=UPI00247482BF|nr:TolC family protein [Variovorax sp. TBS-050B]MDH6590121.1 NodT family efflux transporter outer membrane factor (OMF) lipoprotein [Variovorax sp. TBS-050B]
MKLPFVFALAATAACALLGGCAHRPAGPDYVAPAPLAARQAASTGPFLSGGAATSDAEMPARWWRLFEDPELDGLIARAFEHNTDLRQALATLERATALEAEARGSEQPSITLHGGPSFGHVTGLSVLQQDRSPPSRHSYGMGVAVSYQLDLLGQLRRTVEAAEADTGAARAAVDLVRVAVVGGTAQTYAALCASGRQLRVARASVRLQEEALELALRLQRAGKAGTIDAARVRAQLENLRAAITPLEARRRQSLYRLATLTGAAPRDFPDAVSGCEQPPRVAGLLPVGDGTALLARRPDVRQAERSLASATARIGVATADLYPKVSLGLSSGSAGFLARFANRETFSYSLGPLISWSFPNTGAAHARITQAEATARGAVARFEGTVLTALREAETALDAYARELDRHAALTAARDQSLTVAEHARALLASGKLGQLDVLDAQRTLASHEAALAASDAQLAACQVEVFMALGGGWEDGPAAAPR